MKDIYQIVPPQQYVLTNKTHFNYFFPLYFNVIIYPMAKLRIILIDAYMIKQFHVMLDKLHQASKK